MIGLILNVRRPNHFGSTKSISSLLIPWLLESPGRQHPCYWICQINKRPARAVMHVGIANPRWRGKRSRHSRRMRNPQFYVPGKRPIENWPAKINLLPSLLLCSVCTEYCIMRYNFMVIHSHGSPVHITGRLCREAIDLLQVGSQCFGHLLWVETIVERTRLTNRY